MSGFKYLETNKVSKAQKRRDAKAAKKAEQLRRIEEGEKLDEHKDRKLEQECLKKILDKKKLTIFEVDSDGDCLYRAIEHQLKICSDSLESLGYMEIRQKTSKHMLANRDKFLPFLLNDNGDLMCPSEFESYCDRIARTKDWGGHLELTAISQFTRKPIHIYQADSESPIVIEPDCDKSMQSSPMTLSFHKHLYHLGEHYNSLVKR